MKTERWSEKPEADCPKSYSMLLANDSTKRWLVRAWATAVVWAMCVDSAIFKMKPPDDVARVVRAAGLLTCERPVAEVKTVTCSAIVIADG